MDPEEVVASDEFNRDQKIEILRRREYDARELEVAEEEAGWPFAARMCSTASFRHCTR